MGCVREAHSAQLLASILLVSWGPAETARGLRFCEGSGKCLTQRRYIQAEIEMRCPPGKKFSSLTPGATLGSPPLIMPSPTPNSPGVLP